jgi:hypothetical protein
MVRRPPAATGERICIFLATPRKALAAWRCGAYIESHRRLKKLQASFRCSARFQRIVMEN